MADEPFFPPPPPPADPNAARPATEALSDVPQEPTPAPAPRILTRAEPPPADTEAPPKRSLDREEIRALLAVTAEQRPKRGAWSRARIAFLPVTIVGSLLHYLCGDYGLVASLVLTVAALVWCALPLVKRDEWT